MSWSLISSITGGGFTGSPVEVGPISTIGADLLVVVAQNFNLIGGSDLSDTDGNTWVQLISNEETISNLYIYFSKPTTTSGADTFIISAQISSMQIMAWSGANTAPQGNMNDFSQSSGTSLQAGSITPPEDNCLVIAGICVGASGGAEGFAINGGYTIQGAIDSSSGNNLAGAAAYLIQTSATATNPTWTYNHDVTAAAGIVSFKSSIIVDPTVIMGAMVW